LQKIKQIFLLLSIVFLAGSIFPAKSFSMENENEPLNIVALGDSITYGWNLDPDKTKPSEKAFPYLIGEWTSVINVSHPGWTSTQLLQAINGTPEVTLALQQADVVTLNIGSNDLLQAAGVQQIIKGGVPVVPTPEMQQKVEAASIQLGANLTEIISKIKLITNAPIIMYNIYNPFGPSADPFAASLHALGEHIAKNVNEKVIIPIAYNPGSLLADAYSAFNGKQSQYIIPGDIHPNETGHMVLAGLAADILSSLEPGPNPEYGWVNVDGKWYFLDEYGHKATGAYEMPDGSLYFFDRNGVFQTGWVNHSGKWYYFDSKAPLMITGWIQDKGKWYYLDPNEGGAMKTGWLHDNGKWYYLEPKSGAMKTGWVQDKNKWYYLEHKSGAMKTGWVQDKGKWYFLDQRTGAMKISWIQDKGMWYFLDVKSGAMKTGWLLDKNKWYYLEKTGSMAHSKAVDGYKLGKDGAWIK
jgi:glucan-binding YG repeat protein/lysophospholipase L1-like esterase